MLQSRQSSILKNNYFFDILLVGSTVLSTLTVINEYHSISMVASQTLILRYKNCIIKYIITRQNGFLCIKNTLKNTGIS